MNTFSARKIGEVLAFALVGTETVEQGREALEQVFGKDQVRSYIESNTRHIEVINLLDRDEEVMATIKAKAEATSQKLRLMRDSYVQEQWDDAAELLEWLGFFEGAAVVHWSLVTGVGETEEHDALRQLSDDATKFHKDTLEKVCSAIKSLGTQRSS